MDVYVQALFIQPILPHKITLVPNIGKWNVEILKIHYFVETQLVYEPGAHNGPFGNKRWHWTWHYYF